MKLSYRIILFIFLAFTLWIFFWALFSPKEDLTQRFDETLKEQEKRADLSFKDVTFEEVVAGIKYWQLQAVTAKINKSTEIASLREANGTFFKKGKAVLRFKSPAAIWDMKHKQIVLDQPLGYDVTLERKISSFVKNLKKPSFSVFNLPKIYKKGTGYWFQANKLSWKVDDQKLVCTGKIILTKGEITGFAERLEGDVGLEKVLLEGNPKVIISPNDTYPITLEAEAFEVISPQDLVIARKNPKITWGNARVTADNLKYIQSQENLELNGKVKIIYNDIVAEGDHATYLTTKDQVILQGKAYARQEENKLSGDKVLVALKERKISVLGKGKVIITEEGLIKE